MTSSGSAYGRFRRALYHGNLLAARAAAIELNHVGLVEALDQPGNLDQSKPAISSLQK